MRLFGTLYFIVVIDEEESELGILDLLQNMVDIMDKMFDGASEMDVMYNPDRVNAMVDEIVVAGVIVESNLTEIFE